MNHKFWYKNIGLSRDFRTNAWSAQCKRCKIKHHPKTTMLAHQEIECPDCGYFEVVNWNHIIDEQEKSNV